MTIQRLSLNKPKLNDKIIPTFEIVLAHIKSLGLTEEVLFRVVGKLRKLPPGSYGHFLLNINHHIEQANGKSPDAK